MQEGNSKYFLSKLGKFLIEWDEKGRKRWRNVIQSSFLQWKGIFAVVKWLSSVIFSFTDLICFSFFLSSTENSLMLVSLLSYPRWFWLPFFFLFFSTNWIIREHVQRRRKVKNCYWPLRLVFAFDFSQMMFLSLLFCLSFSK